ncbi:hypothetical protein DPMN_177412 [Dreissena polymorpha]|uniref:Uncharacterized protein n=1 Tax=Dreissena polymorpha TaxID=45954 RepID=A0A9D4IHT5_DREPO|nr:hypothetical protein DPMN_177412 [Dreissena polymorpha]
MLIAGGWIGVFPTSSEEEREQRGSEGGSVEDGRGGPEAAMQTRTSRWWQYENYGSVPGPRYLVRLACWGNRPVTSRAPIKAELGARSGKISLKIVSTPFAELPCPFECGAPRHELS